MIQEFAALAGISRQMVNRYVRKGRFELYGGKIETDDPSIREYLETRGVELPPITGTAAEEPAGAAPESGATDASPPEDKPREKPPTRRAKLEEFRIQQQTLRYKLQNDEVAGRLVPRDLVINAVINPLETEQMRILSDGCQTMAALVHAACAGGASLTDIEKILRKQLSTFIRARKRTMARLLGVRIGEKEGG